MFPEISYSIATSPQGCAADQFSLRPHEWLKWERLTISPIAAVLLATATMSPLNGSGSARYVDTLRDELCDLLDALSAFGIQVPLTVIVSCGASTYADWHRLAGDQNWIRGSFSIEPFSSEAFAGVSIAGSREYATLLTDVGGAHASKYRLERLTNEHYLRMVTERIPNEDALTRSLAEHVLDAFDAFDAEDVINEPLRVGQRGVQDALLRWLDQEVVSRALAITSNPPGGVGKRDSEE
ncbi:hypothetical protein SCB29_33565 [Paraburkholderia sp. SIMBA_055]